MTSVAVPVRERCEDRQSRVQQRWIAQTWPGEREDETVRSSEEESQYHCSPRMSSQVLQLLERVIDEIRA